ncbi:MAG: multicopper oxidase family protein [Acidiferrobacterales bacterium]
MDKPGSITRRDFLNLAGAGSAIALAATHPWLSALAAPSQNFIPDLELELTALRNRVSILSGKSTETFSYRGKVLKGDKRALQPITGSYLGPIIRVHRGQKIRVHFNNDLGEKTIVHWHGLNVPQEADGHPRLAIRSGKRYVYEFEVKDRAGSYWFHPHPHELTGRQVYGGLAGLFLVTDKEEQALNLPSGEFDIPLVIQDRRFNRGNELVYLGSPMERMRGFLGDHILVNGRPDFVLPVATRPYRFRLYNGSNSRIYKLAWDDGTPLTVIGTDGGLLEKPVTRPYITLAPAERIELWVDFSRDKVGTERVLRSLPFEGSMSGGMMGMMMGGGTISMGTEFPVMKVRVERKIRHNVSLPGRLSTIKRYRLNDAVNKKSPRNFRLTMRRMSWGLNGRTFDMSEVAPNEIVKLNTTEVWEFVNDSSMGMMGGGLPHPIHIHGLQFQVVQRTITSRSKSAWRSLSAGLVDGGWKDTVLVMPGERVQLLLRFEDYTGLYLYHCHNLEHEDMGMMRNYQVQA